MTIVRAATRIVIELTVTSIVLEKCNCNCDDNIFDDSSNKNNDSDTHSDS